MGLADFERRLERGVEGAFSRVFRTSVRPVELGRKLVREMDVHRTVAVSGATMAPNDFTFTLAPADHELLADMETTLTTELAQLAKAHAAQERYRLPGPVAVAFEVDGSHRPGVVTLTSRLKQPAPGVATAALVLPGGQRVPLSDAVVTVGRHSDSTIVLGDPNASRRHAEVRPVEGGFTVVDLASTNGTQVNGVRVTERALENGDQIVFGATPVTFETD